ncbi:hypothetical protein HDV05_004320 [Chytridiales sp. JEL 0842]|nr:hypothetical protein HDV05_004320 [Chytridiales sp. JEL 0842]
MAQMSIDIEEPARTSRWILVDAAAAIKRKFESLCQRWWWVSQDITTTSDDKQSMKAPSFSHWDRLPLEIRTRIVNGTDTLTIYLNNYHSLPLTVNNIKEIWRIAIRTNWEGDWSTLPMLYEEPSLLSHSSKSKPICPLSIFDGLLSSVTTVQSYTRLSHLFPSDIQPLAHLVESACPTYENHLMKLKAFETHFPTFARSLMNVVIHQRWTSLENLYPGSWKKSERFRHCLKSWCFYLGHFDFVSNNDEQYFLSGRNGYSRPVVNLPFLHAKYGGVSVLKRLVVDMQFPVNTQTWLAAVEGGKVGCLAVLLASPETLPLDNLEALEDPNSWRCLKLGRRTPPEGLSDLAAERGMLDFIKFLDVMFPADIRASSGSHIFNESTIEVAARYGHLPILTYLRHHRPQLRCPTSAMTLAASKGYLDVVRFLHALGVEGSEAALNSACANGHLDIARFLCQTYEVDVREGFERALVGGHVEIAAFLLEKYPNAFSQNVADERLVQEMAAAGRCSALKFYFERVHHHYPVPASTLHLALIKASANGHLQTFKYLLTLSPSDYIIPSQAFDAAVSNGHLPMVEFISTQPNEGYTTQTLRDSIENSHTRVVHFLLQHRHPSESLDLDVLERVVQFGEVGMLKILMEWKVGGCFFCAYSVACSWNKMEKRKVILREVGWRGMVLLYVFQRRRLRSGGRFVRMGWLMGGGGDEEEVRRRWRMCEKCFQVMYHGSVLK